MKTLDEFVALFAEQFDDTDPSEITATTVFHDLDEYSSLIGLSLIAMVDETPSLLKSHWGQCRQISLQKEPRINLMF